MVISVTVSVSQTPHIRYIQGKIADMLGLELKEESEEGRAQCIWQSLKDKERILIIVDDLWGEFNLRNIGICLDNNYKGRWKVIETTRRQAMCILMDCQKKIHLGLLSTDESWTLFQKHANIDDIFSMSLNDVARELCKECNGLPIAIVAIASSLKGKSIAEWDVALHNLKHSEATDDDVEEGMRAAMSCVKLSYDYLRNKEAKLLFLMCSMFPEDYHISVEDLIRYAVGLGLGGRFSLESARSRIVAGINKLLDCCLLMLVEERENYVKMHDTARLVHLHGGCKNFIPDLVGATGGMNYLTDLRLDQCAEIECIFDATSHSEIDTLIPRLVELWLSGLVNLKELCRGPVLSVSRFFETLEKLNLFECNQLHNIFPRECKIPNLKILTIENRFPRSEIKVLFSMPVAQSLQQLEKLTIKGCKELKHLIASEREHISDASQEIVSASRNSHFVMPRLKEVDIANCYKLECIFPICCGEGLTQLQSIKIKMAPELKYVFGECDHEGNSCLQCENQIMTPHLEVLKLSDLKNLIGICPENYHAMWPSNWKLTVYNCPKFTAL